MLKMWGIKSASDSDGSGMEKVGFGRVRLYPNFQLSGSDMSGIGKVWFGRVLKFRVSLGTESIFSLNHKLVMGRVWKKSGSGGYVEY